MTGSSVQGGEAESKPAKARPAPGVPPLPGVEVLARAIRQSFSAAGKERILGRAAAPKDSPGGVGALLRREGLGEFRLSASRHNLKAGRLRGPGDEKGRPAPHDIRRLVGQVRRLEQRLHGAETVIERAGRFSAEVARRRYALVLSVERSPGVWGAPG